MENLSWDDLRVLLAIHRSGSMLVAGKTLGLSTSTTARRLDALELAVGQKLVYRSQTGTLLKPEALRMIRLAEVLEHGLDAMRRDQTTLAGKLRVSVPEGLAQTLARALLAFQQSHPGIDLELIGESRMADVAEREADIAIRLVRSRSNTSIEKRLTSFGFRLFAAGQYVRARLPRRSLGAEDAPNHCFIGLEERWKNLPHEQWLLSLGAKRFVFRSSSMEAIAEAVRQGAGMAAFIEDDPRTAGLISIRTHIAGPSQSCFLVYHRDLRDVPHVRAAISAIETYFSNRPPVQ